VLKFIRSDLSNFVAYTPHPSGTSQVAPDLVDHLDTNESPFDLPEDLKQKLAWTYQQNIAANRYPDGGHEALKAAIAEYVNESAALSSQPLNAHHISVGNGSDELIRSLLIATCLGGEGTILVADPTFSMYAILAQTLGIPVVKVGRSLTNFEIDLAAAQQVIDSTQNPPVRAVFVVHPNSPTGNLLTTAEIDWLKALPDHVLVVVDEAYFEFSQTTLVSELHQRPNWVILRTFSKAFRLAAHRVGYAIAHPDLIVTLEKVRLPYNLPSFSQAAAQLALSQRQLLLSTIPALLAERDLLSQSLQQHSALQVWDSRANFIYLRLRTDTATTQDALTRICEALRQQGTLIRHTSGGLRITVGTPEENQRTLDRLSKILQSGSLNL
jgi:histidinol-phosphate aminotransferase